MPAPTGVPKLEHVARLNMEFLADSLGMVTASELRTTMTFWDIRDDVTVITPL